ncbi:hypothetical protein HIM_08410 [Hirsutella minnesotensis 3608]|uniref:3-carboxymuconate cyclase n=1 Tax=Hirsutella minnesotensis 3608 TaxID=1043627 RepID=A0A0F7ZMK2_9HYPO|nr:hypothetical protein HIM_08410 [Hirsutella minnesotensis 3608]
MPCPLISSVLLALLALPLGILARPSGNGGSASMHMRKAVYFMTNSDENAVVAVPIGADGKLSGGTRTPTGGRGSVSIYGPTMSPAAKDGLISQSSLSIAGSHLFVVNAGSNTVSMFAINPRNPSQLALVGKPAAVPGEFINTVAASAKNAMVCVGATGAVAGISCANFDAQAGIGEMDQLREYELNQSTPPVGPTNTVSQVFWSNDERMLFVTVKGDPMKNNTGFLSAFPTQKSMSATALSRQEMRSPIKGTAVLFGSLPIPKTSNIFATDGSFGGAILSVAANGQGSLVAKQPIAGQKATCWVTISPARKTAFVTDVGVPKLVEMSLKDASIMQSVDLSSTGATGMIDLMAVGNFIYVLAPGDGKTHTQILVVSAGSRGQKVDAIQRFDVEALGAGALSQGMVAMD